jgi:predicted phosphoribosyltransferase
VLHTVPPFLSIGEDYEDFSQTSDNEVLACLQRAAKSELRGLVQVG